jgi:predicted nucleic acid-binding Zn ribbon protein
MSAESKERGLASIEDVLGRWIKRNKTRQRVDKEAIFSRWKEVVGEDLGKQTRAVDIQAGTLLVEVDSAPLLNELSTYFREDILASLRQLEEFRNIGDIRFRAGTF